MPNRIVQETVQDNHFALLPGAWGVYLNEMLRRISTSMVGLFIPLYIYKETGDILEIPIYYFIFSIVALVGELPSALIIKKIGIDKGMALGSFFRSIFIFSLIFAQNNHQLFWVSAVAYGITMPFDWLPHHYALAKIAKIGHHFGSVASNSKIFTRVGSTLGPVMGGLCIQFFGFNTLYLISGSLIVVAGIVPFLDSFEKSGMHVSGKEIFKRILDPGIIKHLIVSAVEYADGAVSMMIWPLFLYTIVGSYSKSGALETTTLLVGIIGLYGIGKLVKHKKYYVMRWGSIAIIVGWLGRMFLHTITGLWISNLIYLIGVAFLWTPLWSLLYARSVAKKYTMEFWLVHEIIGHGMLALCCFMVWMGLSKGISLQTIIAVLTGLLTISLSFPWLFKGYIKRYG